LAKSESLKKEPEEATADKMKLFQAELPKKLPKNLGYFLLRAKSLLKLEL